MKSFEIPYNFDKNLIDYLVQKDSNGNLYYSIYMPPYIQDYCPAKKFYQGQEGITGETQQNLSREQYESHISYIKQYFPDKLMLLLQQNNMCMSKELLKYYIDLGFTKFCAGSIQQAQLIRELFPSAEIVASITMKVSPTDLLNKEFEIFDGIVLWFPYNRKLSVIKTLPKKYKYILLVNCDCNIYCDGTYHWFASKEEEENLICPNYTDNNWANKMRIYPWDLPIFEPYIDYYKLQGRDFPTYYLIQDIEKYSKEYNNIKLREEKYENINFHF